MEEESACDLGGDRAGMSERDGRAAVANWEGKSSAAEASWCLPGLSEASKLTI